jgi:hypothetical protein
MAWDKAAFWVFAVAVALIVEGTSRWRLRAMARRDCAGRRWLRSFPGASKADIREFLGVVVDCFRLPGKYRLKFGPEERILDVYRAIHVTGMPDSLELETFALELERRYQLKLESMWRADLTIGEVFGRTVGT